ncbi:glycine/D-amino acid oxidase-like deaminating enzyme [Sphingomonas naasensis]|uniref:Tryptophan 7-halogenase n=1 Tax=Sphingomonas naasensis TaxID=1344951 RepID=A0A4S1WSF5_9SPHN|nr:tryptophan halogenase family protein [Sphingomonas naasensis]NIJ19159.1 glycine/D-amino acid oxidase-like deaminating enzyme [Sphingomonas naasensis]TGX46348.1 tryptophan 7-halogenase [Sphingomonas naasensis]
MPEKRGILVVGGGTAGWLTAAYLARFFEGRIAITLLESPEIGIIGVGEGAFPTIRSTLKFLGIDESHFIRAASATFKQGIRFNDWLHAPGPGGRRHHYLHPFEAPFYTEGASLVPYWLLQDPATRPPFAEAVTIQNRVAEAQRAPKRPGEGDYAGPLNYAYHFDARRLAELLEARAVDLGVRHLRGLLTDVELDADGSIAAIRTAGHGRLEADLYIDCSGFRAELIGKALGARFQSVRHQLFTDRALACKIPYDRPDAPIESFTVATAHAAGWTWDIGLEGARGIGCVYSSAHMADDEAAAVLRDYVGHDRYSARIIPFEPGYRAAQWVGNCVSVGLSGGFLEPLESTGVVLIEAAVGMIAELFPHNGPAEAPAARFNALMAARYANIINFLKLHYCLSRRPEPFWRDNADPASIPAALQELLAQWRWRPPSRFDFTLDLESFAFFNYQYILYGMEFGTDLAPGRGDFPNVAAAEKLFARIRGFSERATEDLPAHRALIREINAGRSLGA